MKSTLSQSARIYVAGHRGLLGSAVVRRLQAEGFSNLILRTSSEVDLTNQSQAFAFLDEQKPEYVFDCAAKVGGIKANMIAPAEFLYRNLEIQNNLFEGCRRAGVKKLLFVGSSCIYPGQAPCPIKESALLTGPFEPTNEGYAIAKVAGVRMCQFYRKQYDCDYVAAIPTNLFGINDHYDLEKSHLLPALIRKVHDAKTEGRRVIEVWGSGTPRREFMLSDDCADALVFLMKNYSGGEPVNVGTGVDHTVIELAQAVARVLAHDVEIKTDPTKPDGMMRKLVDVTRLAGLGWRSGISLEQGIRVAYDDFLSQLREELR